MNTRPSKKNKIRPIRLSDVKDVKPELLVDVDVLGVEVVPLVPLVFNAPVMPLNNVDGEKPVLDVAVDPPGKPGTEPASICARSPASDEDEKAPDPVETESSELLKLVGSGGSA
jgi:hypothetical protein